MDYTPNDEPRLSEEASKHRVNRNGAGPADRRSKSPASAPGCWVPRTGDLVLASLGEIAQPSLPPHIEAHHGPP
jgi:hypothetical protein